MRNIFITFFLLISLGLNKHCFAMNTLSPRLNITKSIFQAYSQFSLEKLQEHIMDSKNPSADFNAVIYRINLNAERLIVRKRIENYSDEIEVHHTLTRVETNGRETYLGQCWYTLDQNQAVLQESYDMIPALSIVDKGKGYGSVLFAAVMENARENQIDRFLIVQPTTSLYRKFGFQEIADYGLEYKNLSPEDMPAFTIARDLAIERGNSFNVKGLTLFAPQPSQPKTIVKLHFDTIDDLIDASI